MIWGTCPSPDSIASGANRMLSPDAYAAELHVTAKGDYRLVIRPVICDADGLPVPAGGEDGERICERVVRLSAQLNSDARTVDGAVEIDLRSA
jgi:hypothetical protein